MNFYRFLNLVFVLLLVSAPIYCAYANKSDNPQINGQFEWACTTPNVLKATFEHQVTLISITLKRDNNIVLSLDSQTLAKQILDAGQFGEPDSIHRSVFYIKIPELSNAEYQLSWTVQDVNDAISNGHDLLSVSADNTFPRPSTKKHRYNILHKKLNH
ncbi:hypothetical protein ACRWQL_14360 [Shewanella sp. HL-SH4]|uniref:hypothetical protein n=1 Tax=Shewanella sp. HL-SH4 TaxID=3436240 RepID=UPI003EC12604